MPLQPWDDRIKPSVRYKLPVRALGGTLHSIPGASTLFTASQLALFALKFENPKPKHVIDPQKPVLLDLWNVFLRYLVLSGWVYYSNSLKFLS